MPAHFTQKIDLLWFFRTRIVGTLPGWTFVCLNLRAPRTSVFCMHGSVFVVLDVAFRPLYNTVKCSDIVKSPLSQSNSSNESELLGLS